MAAMDSCFALIGVHQHGMAVQSMNGGAHVSKTLYCRGEVSPLRLLYFSLLVLVGLFCSLPCPPIGKYMVSILVSTG